MLNLTPGKCQRHTASLICDIGDEHRPLSLQLTTEYGIVMDTFQPDAKVVLSICQVIVFSVKMSSTPASVIPDSLDPQISVEEESGCIFT